jgi:cell division protein FtsB
LETVTKPEAPAKPDSFRPVLGAAVVLFMVLLALAGLKSYRDLSAARERERVLETGIEDMRARSAKLRTRIERLRNDPGTLERRAREDLGMVRPGDVIIELPADGMVPAKAPVPPPPAPAPAPPPPTPVATPGVALGSGAGVAPAQNP